MAKTASGTPPAPAEEALKQRKKQARREAKLMLEIGVAKKDLKKAQNKQSKAQARLEEQSTHLLTLEAKLQELRAQGPQPDIEPPPHKAELEHRQEPSEMEGGAGTASSSSEAGTSPSIDEEPTPPFVEEATPPAAPAQAPAQKTGAARKPAATKRPASRSQKGRQPSSAAEQEE